MPSFIKPKRLVNRVFLHCSASDNPDCDDIKVIKEWHLAKIPPWDDVGYHFFINKKGEIQQGRSLEKSPAAQFGNNAKTIAICVSGLKDFTQESFDSLKELCYQIRESYGNITFHGHCEVSNKECPVFDYKKVLGLDSRGYIFAKIVTAYKKEEKEEVVKKPLWKFW